jgi:hypothetical protein
MVLFLHGESAHLARQVAVFLAFLALCERTEEHGVLEQSASICPKVPGFTTYNTFEYRCCRGKYSSAIFATNISCATCIAWQISYQRDMSKNIHEIFASRWLHKPGRSGLLFTYYLSEQQADCTKGCQYPM